MRPAVIDLAKFSDDRLFKEISEGITHIVENAVSLDDTARRLCQAQEYRAAEILRGFAEEEAAKVLILIDAVRCPSDRPEKAETLKSFYNHIAKKIYAMMCSWRGCRVNFEEMRQTVELECRSLYLDGPNDVDWIFPNSIKAERERAMYVDYVQDVTEVAGSYFWNSPHPSDLYPRTYETPASVNIARAICQIGASTPKGLAIVAEIWRGFEPTSETSVEDLMDLKVRTVERFIEEDLCSATDPGRQLVMADWLYPLWPLRMLKRLHKEEESLEDLRRDRTAHIRSIQEMEAKKDPPPVISRDKVEALNNAYRQWDEEKEKKWNDAHPESKDQKLRVWSLSEVEKLNDYDLPSFKRLKNMFQQLTEHERADLLALAWFTRERIADWPAVREYAHTRISTVDDNYQIGLASCWLAGFNRWEEKPRSFQPGQSYQRR